MDARSKSYRQVETLGKSQVELILQVYDGALTALREADRHYRNEALAPGREALEKVKRFLTHLYTTLDEEHGGEIAANLGRLYAYLIDQVNLAQGTREKEVIDNCIKVLTNLREAWVGLGEQEKNRPTGEANEAPAAGNGINAMG
jgi:flagellar protein FliS